MEPGEPITSQHPPTGKPLAPVPTEKKASAMKNVREWVQVIAIALIISLPIRFFIAEPFVVNGASMDPTFSTGQFLIVDRLTYRFESPKRGDVIVFKYPGNTSIYYIKRIIGLPNESVSIRKGAVSITSSSTPGTIALKEPYVDAAHKSYDDFDIKLGSTEYFVMGDNRAQSFDSRAWGPLDRNLIVGEPIVRLLPADQISVWPGEYKE